jgi:hypothetical protein
MSETHVVSALRSKRAEVAGYIAVLEKRASNWRARLAHIDGALKIFSPETDPDAIPARRSYRRSRYFQRGEFSSQCLKALREVGGPTTTAALVRSIMAAKGLPSDDPALFNAVNEKALCFLRGLVKRGIVSKTGVSRDARWTLVNG